MIRRILATALSAAALLTLPPLSVYAQSKAAPKLSEAPALAGLAPAATAPKAVAEPAAGYVAPAAGAVTVNVPMNASQSACGSGFVVWAEAGKSYVVTNKHVVVDKLSPTAMTVTLNSTRKVYPARFVGWSREGDVALLEIDAELPAVVLADEDAKVGTATTHYGNATGPQRGTLRAYRELAMDRPSHPWSGWVALGTHHVISGDSGAGVYNDRGELVAVLWGGHPGDMHAAPVGVVRSLLSRVVANRLPRLAARLNTNAAVAATAPEPESNPAVQPKAAAEKLWDVRDVDGKVYRGVPESQVRTRFPGARFPGDPGYCADGTCRAPGGAAGVTYYYYPAGSSCANGRCPTSR